MENASWSQNPSVAGGIPDGLTCVKHERSLCESISPTSSPRRAAKLHCAEGFGGSNGRKEQKCQKPGTLPWPNPCWQNRIQPEQQPNETVTVRGKRILANFLSFHIRKRMENREVLRGGPIQPYVNISAFIHIETHLLPRQWALAGRMSNLFGCSLRLKGPAVRVVMPTQCCAEGEEHSPSIHTYVFFLL